MSDFISLK